MDAQSVLVASVAGAVISFLISFLKRWVVVSRFWNYVIAFIVTVILVIAWDFIQGNGADWVIDFPSKIAIMFTTSQLAYGLVIKQLGWDERIEGVAEKK